MQKHKSEIDEIYTQLKSNSDSSYMNFENVEVLCRRCHFAEEKGLVLCQVCGKNYHKPQYEKCWKCLTESTVGKRITKKKKDLAYTHPWCSKTFYLKAEWWDIEANPHMCCIEHCEDDCNSCDKARKNWL